MKVLFVDDNEAILENFSMLIRAKRADIEIVTVSSGIEALELLPDGIDVILSDIKMPGLDGFGLKKELNRKGLKIPLIFISAIPTVDNLLISRQLGAVGFLSKPISSDDLIEGIERAYQYSKLITAKPELLTPVAELLIIQTSKEPILKTLSEDYTIGRSEQSDIRINSLQVSREHCLLNRTQESYTEDNPRHHYRIIDYSRNGFEVNGNKINGYCLLNHNDIIVLPNCEMRYFIIQTFTKTNLRGTLPSEQ